jgi:uncharacterized membrane protein YqjE
MEGPLSSVRALAGSFLALLRTRVELAVVELREEAERRKEMAVLAAVAGVFLMMGALLLAFFVIVVFWESHRITAAAAVTVIYLGIGVIALMRLNRARRDAPRPFEATLAELAQDVEALRGKHE